MFHSAVYSVTNLRFYFVYCEYFWSPKVMQCFLYLILCATSPAHFESCCQKHSDELLFSFDLNNVTRHVRQTVVTITKSECSLSLKTEQYRVLLNHFSKVKC